MTSSALHRLQTLKVLLELQTRRSAPFRSPELHQEVQGRRAEQMARVGCSSAIAVALFLLLCGGGQAESSQMQDSLRPSATSLVSVSQQASQDLTEDGFEFLKEMSDEANNLRTYSFQSEQLVFKGNKSTQEKVNFFFKKPKLIRAEEVGDYKRGSVAVLLSNGSVRGHLGGLLSKINATLDAKSDWVVGANGYPLVDSDFYSMSLVMVNFVKEGKKCLVTGSPVKVTGQPNPVYVLELYTDASKKQLMKRAYISPENLLPVEWFDYKDGKLFAHTVWRNLRLNTELNDSLFQL